MHNVCDSKMHARTVMGLRKTIWMGAIVAGWISAQAAGCAGAPSQRPAKLGPVDTGAGSVESTRRALAGNWTLGSLEVIGSDGVRQTVKAHGTLSYDAFGSLIVNGVIDDPRLTNAVVLNYTGRIVIDPAKHQFYPADFNSEKPVDAAQIAPVSLDKGASLRSRGRQIHGYVSRCRR